jgi:hypothetical protein
MKFRHISSLGLLLLLAAPLAFCLFLMARQQQAILQAKENLKTKALVTIRVAENALHWVKPNKEIQLPNQDLFDVKTIKKEGKVYIITGLFDEAEKQIKKQIKKLQQSNANNQANALGRFLGNLLTPALCNTLHPVSDFSFFLFTKSKHNHFSSSPYQSPHLENPVPPPNAWI